MSENKSDLSEIVEKTEIKLDSQYLYQPITAATRQYNYRVRMQARRGRNRVSVIGLPTWFVNYLSYAFASVTEIASNDWPNGTGTAAYRLQNVSPRGTPGSTTNDGELHADYEYFYGPQTLNTRIDFLIITT